MKSNAFISYIKSSSVLVSKQVSWLGYKILVNLRKNLPINTVQLQTDVLVGINYIHNGSQQTSFADRQLLCSRVLYFKTVIRKIVVK